MISLTLVSCFESEPTDEEKSQVYNGHKKADNQFTVSNPDSATYYKLGDTLKVPLVFPMDVTVTGSPYLTISLGGTSRTATFVTPAVDSETIEFEYTVQASDLDLDGVDLPPSITLNGGSIVYRTEYDANTDLIDTSISNLRVDGIVPTVSSITAPTNGTYTYLQNIYLSLNFSENVYVNGVPRISFDLAGATKYFTYYQGNGTTTLDFVYQVQGGTYDNDGIVIGSTIDFNGGKGIRDIAGNILSTTISPPATGSVIVNGDAPVIQSVKAPTNKKYGIGNTLSFDVTFNEAVTVSGAPRIQLTVGAATLYADYASGTGTTKLTFDYTVSPGENDSDGIAVVSPLQLNLGSIKDAGGRDAILTFTAPNTQYVFVDGDVPLAPTFSAILPESPSNKTDPIIQGTTEAYATVRLYSDACSTLVATKTASSLGSFTFSLSGLSVGSYNYYGQVTDLAGNVSGCTAGPLNYVVYAMPSGIGWFQSTSSTNGVDLNLTTEYSLDWSTLSRFDYNYFSHSTTTNSEKIKVKVAGHYLLSLNLPLFDTGSGQRVGAEAKVYVNGAVLEEGVSSSSYIRFTSGHEESSGQLNIMLSNLSVNDEIEVKVEAISSITGQVNVLEAASLYLEYMKIGESLFYAKATDVTGGTDINVATNNELQWTAVLKDSASYAHSNVAAPETITFAASGDYMVYVNLPMTSAVQRASTKIRVYLNGSPISGAQGKQGYIRALDNHFNASAHWAGLITGVASTDVLTIKTEVAGEAGTVTVRAAKKATLLMRKVDTTENILALNGTTVEAGTNWNQSSNSAVQWSAQDVNDVTNYTHSTSVNNHEIQIETAGDYLVYYSNSLTSTAQRANVRSQIYVNGSPVSGAITSSNYIRAGSAHVESSALMMYYLKDLSVNDIVTMEIIKEAITGTVTADDNAKILFWYKPY